MPFVHAHELTRLRRALVIAASALLAAAPQLGAQQKANDPRDTTHAQTQAPFFTRKDAFLGAGFAVGTVLMFPLDEHIAQHIHQSPNSSNFLNNLSTGVEEIASPGAYYIGGGLYLVGWAGHWGRIQDLGWHGTESVLMADAITYVLKVSMGRARPFVSNGTNAHDFRFAQGGASDRQSFPSGHSTSAFAAAAAVTNETSRWWPRSVWIVGPLMYGGAGAVALSRMYHNKHWASDVVLGAAIGTFTGRKVVQYSHGHPGNLIDRVMLRTAVVPDGHGGLALSYTAPLP
jgi:membrane-associated phospholipid phosphatase